MKENDSINVNGHIIPKQVFDKVLEYSSSGEKIGLWEARNPSDGYFGFIIGPIKNVEEAYDKFKINGYRDEKSPGGEYIPEPILVHEPQMRKDLESFNPIDGRERNRGIYKKYITKMLQEPGPGVTANSMLKSRVLIKKSQWEEIGRKTGWMKDLPIEKKAAFPVVGILVGVLASVGISYAIDYAINWFGSEEQAEKELGLQGIDPNNISQEEAQNIRNNVLSKMSAIGKGISSTLKNIENDLVQLRAQTRQLSETYGIQPCVEKEINIDCESNNDSYASFITKYNQLKNNISHANNQLSYCDLIDNLLTLRLVGHCLMQRDGTHQQEKKQFDRQRLNFQEPTPGMKVT